MIYELTDFVFNFVFCSFVRLDSMMIVPVAVVLVFLGILLKSKATDGLRHTAMQQEKRQVGR